MVCCLALFNFFAGLVQLDRFAWVWCLVFALVLGLLLVGLCGCFLFALFVAVAPLAGSVEGDDEEFFSAEEEEHEAAGGASTWKARGKRGRNGSLLVADDVVTQNVLFFWFLYTFKANIIQDNRV